MKKSEKNALFEEIAHLSDKELEKKAYDAIYGCLGSQCDDMYELGYDMADILERQKYEKYLSEKADVFEMCCNSRGITLFGKDKKE